MHSETDPAVVFRFRVMFDGLNSDPQKDVSFQSVTGLEAYIETKKTHKAVIGTIITFPSLVLRRPVIDIKDSSLSQWVFSWVNGKSNPPISIVRIELLNERRETLMRWSVMNVIPKSWKLGELNSEESGVLYETIELSYTDLIFDK